MGGISLLFTLCCSFYVVNKLILNYLPDNIKNTKSFEKRQWVKRISSILALLLTISLWWFQSYYNHNESSEAIAKKEVNELIDLWRSGKKSDVMHRLNYLATSELPWETGNFDIFGD